MLEKPKSLEDLKKQRKVHKNVHSEVRKKLSKLDKFAVWITEKIGTMGFFLIIFGWTFIWLLWNIFAPTKLQFDPYPGFILWLFISNLLQILLMPLLMLGQNIQGQHSEIRAEQDLEVNIKAEQEIEVILEHLEYQNELLLKILDQKN